MAKVKLLDKELTNMISAGEVVERPASVVKELVENSIDANADTIVVEIKDGGKTYIRVSDNGEGMTLEDARAAFICHATSKISKIEDLFNIKTMGFRGEAVPAIASVSHVELLTASKEDKYGHKLIFDAGREVYYEEVGLGKGTTIVVKDLFFYVPARLNFLKKDATETANIVSLMNKLAIGNPNISFKLIVDGKTMLSTQKDFSFLDIVYAVFGKDIAENLLPVKLSERGIEIVGYIGKPRCSRSNRNFQLFYVNDRVVKNKTIIAALDRAFHNKLMNGKHPVAILKFYISTREVDVNVHPTKSEVRFSNDQKVFDATYYAVLTALSKENAVTEGKAEPAAEEELTQEERYNRAVENYYKGLNKPVVNVPVRDMSEMLPSDEEIAENESEKEKPKKSNNYFMPLDDLFTAAKERIKTVDSFKDKGKLSRNSQVPPEELSRTYITDNPNQLITFYKTEVEFRYIGELFKTYLIVECGTSFFLIDKHAAHEKILFDKIYESYKNGVRFTQELLTSVPVTLTPEENDALWSNADKVSAMGFTFDKFGKYEVILRGVPYVLSTGDMVPTFLEAIELASQNKNLEITELETKVIKMLACKAAIKAGHDTSEYELKQFVEKIIRAGNVNYCPHGRPIICEFSKKSIEKIFKRIV